MAKAATTKATMFPTNNKVRLLVLNNSGCSPHKSQVLFAVAPNMVGTAKKNENSAACFLPNPCVNPPIMVAAERLTPGTIANT